MSDQLVIEPIKERVPVDAEARGKARLFRQTIAKRMMKLDAVLFDDAFNKDIALWRLKRKKGRERVEARIRKRLGGMVRWYACPKLDGLIRGDPRPHDVLLAAYLRPDKHLLSDPRHPGEAQDSIVVNCLMISEPEVFNGVWTIEFPDHALGRVMQRYRSANLEEIIYSAHEEVLAIGVTEVLYETKKGWRFKTSSIYLPTPPHGAFVCELIQGRDETTEENCAVVRARTWLHIDQAVIDLPSHFLQKSRPTLGELILAPPALRNMFRQDIKRIRLSQKNLDKPDQPG